MDSSSTDSVGEVNDIGYKILETFSDLCQGSSSQDTHDSPPHLPDPTPKAIMQSMSDAPAKSTPEPRLPSRNRRLPARYRDMLPEPPLPAVDPHPPYSSSPMLPRVILHVFDSFRTQFNRFGIARAYRHRPSHDPDSYLSVEELSQTNEAIRPNSAEGDAGDYSPPWPWSNMSVWRLMRWKESGGAHKSDTEVTRLVREVFQAPDFNIHDLTNFDASRETCRMEAAQKKIPQEDPFGIDKWQCTSVNISVPTREKNKKGNGRIFTIDGFRYRPILDVIRAVFAEASSKSFHLTPFKKLWKSPVTGHEQRVYDELYTSNAWNQAQDEIMKQKSDASCKLEKVVADLMFWSDSTHLAQFSHTSAWPIYLFFGNLSKYARANPQSGCCHPIAFIPSVR